MPKIIIGLENQVGYRLKNAVLHYCQITGNPQTPEVQNNIYHEVIAQVMNVMCSDFQNFSLGLLEIPDWRTIHYLDAPVDYARVKDFAEEIRAFGIYVYHRLSTKNNLNGSYVYVLESCTENYLIVGAYISADDL